MSVWSTGLAVRITKFVIKSCPSRALMLFAPAQLQTCATLAVEAAFCCVPTSHEIKESVHGAGCLGSPCSTLQGPLQPTLASLGVRICLLRSDRSAGNKQMVPGELYLLMLERGLNLFCWFTFHFTPCHSGWEFLHSKCPKSRWSHRDFDWGILYVVNQKLSWTNEGTGRFVSALSFEVLLNGASKNLHFHFRH